MPFSYIPSTTTLFIWAVYMFCNQMGYSRLEHYFVKLISIKLILKKKKKDKHTKYKFNKIHFLTMNTLILTIYMLILTIYIFSNISYIAKNAY